MWKTSRHISGDFPTNRIIKSSFYCNFWRKRNHLRLWPLSQATKKAFTRIFCFFSLFRGINGVNQRSTGIYLQLRQKKSTFVIPSKVKLLVIRSINTVQDFFNTFTLLSDQIRPEIFWHLRKSDLNHFAQITFNLFSGDYGCFHPKLNCLRPITVYYTELAVMSDDLI